MLRHTALFRTFIPATHTHTPLSIFVTLRAHASIFKTVSLAGERRERQRYKRKSTLVYNVTSKVHGKIT